jgi:signal transduction histidine kinase
MTKRDRLLPAAALLAVLTVAVIVIALLRSATNNGTTALEEAKVAQVPSTANSFNARIESSIGAIGGLGSRPWELTPGSATDGAALNAFAIDPEAISGFFLVDGNDTIVNGILLRPGRLGSTYDPPTWADVKKALASAPAVVLPVTTDGVTSELPTYAFAVAIRGATPTSVRGAFVFEQALTADSTFSLEIQALVDTTATTAAWRFVDSNGTVVASSLATGLGDPIPNPDLATLEEGQHIIDGDLVVSADVPAVGWHLVFTQSHSEFVEPLAGPLQTAGLILAVLLMVVGVTLTTVLARRLRQAREEERRLRELHRAQDEFISVVSHELRTPVSGILGFLQTTLDHWPAMSEDDRRQAVRRAFMNARRLQAMARDVLDTESIESGEFGYDRHPIDLAEEVRTAVGACDGDAGQVTLSVPDGEIIIDGDPDRIQQVLANLLDNALKFSAPDTLVAVALEQTDRTARITVVDHGAAIDADQLDRIFDKFVRVHEGTATGTGLGLYIARRIIEAHDGRIWAESHPGGETHLILELPCRAGPVD